MRISGNGNDLCDSVRRRPGRRLTRLDLNCNSLAATVIASSKMEGAFDQARSCLFPPALESRDQARQHACDLFELGIQIEMIGVGQQVAASGQFQERHALLC